MPTVLGYRHRRRPFGVRGYKAISKGTDDLGQKGQARFRYRNGHYEEPSCTRFREVLIFVDPTSLDLALQGWISQYADVDEGLAITLLLSLEITGKTITADALITQRDITRYLVEVRGAHYLFITKQKQPTLLADIRLFFESRGSPDFQEPLTLEHGRLESRLIWTTIRLNDYLNFPFVGQVFAIERLRIEKKTGETSTQIV